MTRIDFESFYFETEICQEGDVKIIVVSFCGKISNNNAFEISKKIGDIFEDKIYNVILNLSALEYINSMGVALLLTVIKTIDQKNGKIAIGGINQFLETVLNLIEIPKEIVIYDSVDKARASWS